MTHAWDPIPSSIGPALRIAVDPGAHAPARAVIAKVGLERSDSRCVVEGYSDLLFYAEMLAWIGKHDGMYIKEMGGKGNLRPATFAMPTLTPHARENL